MDNFTRENSSFTNSCPNDVVCLLEVVVVIAVTYLTLVSNALNLIILISTPSFRNSHGYLLVSLSVADLCVGCTAALSIYPSATLRGSVDSWPYGDTACLIKTYIGQVALATSGYTLTTLSVERYIAVAHPLKYARIVTKKTTVVAIAFGWLFCLSVLATVFAGLPSHEYVPEFYTCQPAIMDNSLFSVMIFAMVLPALFIILVTSIIISRKLMENDRRRAAMTPGIAPSSNSQESNSSRGTSPKSIRLFRIVRIMAFAVFLSWMPFIVLVFITVLFDVQVAQVIAFSLYWLLISNSFINSIIYYATNSKFRDRVHELTGTLAPKCCHKKFERGLVCACCTWKRTSRAYETTSGVNPQPKMHSSPHRSQGEANVELLTVRTERVDSVVNGGFRDSESPLTLQPTEQSQTLTIH